MRKLLAVLLFGFASVFNSFSAPTSAEQLRSEFETALKAKDTNAMMSLIYWKNVSENGKSIQAQEIADMVTHDIVSVELASWPTNLPLENDYNGIHYKPNLKVIGMVNVKFANKQGAVGSQMPYGQAGDSFLVAATIGEKSAAASTNQLKN